MEITEVRRIVADMLVKVGHGNALFIKDVREGRQDDGPFMRAGMAVRDEFLRCMLPAPEDMVDGK